MSSKVTKTVRFEPYWEDKLDDSSEDQEISFSEIVRKRCRFGLSRIEYRQLEKLADEQDVSETEVVEQGMKFMSVAMNPDLSFADAIKSMPEMVEAIYNRDVEDVED